MLWIEGKTFRRHEEGKGGRLHSLGKFTGVLDVSGMDEIEGKGGAGIPVDMGNWEDWGYYEINGK